MRADLSVPLPAPESDGDGHEVVFRRWCPIPGSPFPPEDGSGGQVGLRGWIRGGPRSGESHVVGIFRASWPSPSSKTAPL